MPTLLLLLLMTATRAHHFGDGFHLPDASWAVFFLLGWIGQRAKVLAIFLAVAACLDVWVVSMTSVSADCFSLGYLFLLPAYSMLWLIGKYMRGQSLISILLGLTLAVTCTFIISNLGMWLFSPSAKALSLLEYSQRVVGYWSSYWQITVLYSLLGMLLFSRVYKHQQA